MSSACVKLLDERFPHQGRSGQAPFSRVCSLFTYVEGRRSEDAAPGFLLAKEHGDQAVPCLILGFERTQELFPKEKAVRAEGALDDGHRCPDQGPPWTSRLGSPSRAQPFTSQVTAGRSRQSQTAHPLFCMQTHLDAVLGKKATRTKRRVFYEKMRGLRRHEF